MLKRLLIGVIALVIGLGIVGVVVSDSTAQTFPPLDDTEHIESQTIIADSVITFRQLGRSIVDGSIWYLESIDGVQTENRPATNGERNYYLDIERLINIENWIATRTANLQQCESDGTAGLALGNFTAMSNGQQNAVVESLLTCQIENSKVNRKTINALFDILQANDLDVN